MDGCAVPGNHTWLRFYFFNPACRAYKLYLQPVLGWAFSGLCPAAPLPFLKERKTKNFNVKHAIKMACLGIYRKMQ
jgi:hypothetical protein